MTLSIVRHSETEMLQSLAAYLPGGELFQAAFVPGSNFNALLAGLSGELLRAENFLFLYNSEFIPDETTVFIEEWESAVGIPDDCFLTTSTETNEVRRRNILVKLASLGVQTVDDFENLAVLMGFPDVEVLPGMLAPLGSELVTNGDFSSAASWTVVPDWAISGGTANKAGTAAPSRLEQTISVVDESFYFVQFDVLNYSSGELNIMIGGTSGAKVSANGTYIQFIESGATGDICIDGSTDDFIGSVDNVSVKALLDGIENPRFTIYVDLNFEGNNYPLEYAYPYGTDANDIIRCLFEKLKPANCDVVFSS